MSPSHTCPLRVQRRPTNGDRRWKINCNKRGNTRGPLAPELNVETLSLPARRKILLPTFARGRWRSTLKLGARATVLCSVVAIYFPPTVKHVAFCNGTAKLAHCSSCCHGPWCSEVGSWSPLRCGDICVPFPYWRYSGDLVAI